MPKIKLTKTAVDAATPQERDYELRGTTIPGFLVKVTPAGRKIFMVAYVAHNGQRRKPAIGRYGEITVEQARGIAQDWLAEVRRGVDPSAERATARQASKYAALSPSPVLAMRPRRVHLSGLELAGHRAEVGAQICGASEPIRSIDGGLKGQGRHRAHPRNAHEAHAQTTMRFVRTARSATNRRLRS